MTLVPAVLLAALSANYLIALHALHVQGVARMELARRHIFESVFVHKRHTVLLLVGILCWLGSFFWQFDYFMSGKPTFLMVVKVAFLAIGGKVALRAYEFTFSLLTMLARPFCQACCVIVAVQGVAFY